MTDHVPPTFDEWWLNGVGFEPKLEPLYRQIAHAAWVTAIASQQVEVKRWKDRWRSVVTQTGRPLRPIIVRPQYAEVAAWGINHCGFCGDHLWTSADTERHWSMGHFDRLINPGAPDYPEALTAQETLAALAEAT